MTLVTGGVRVRRAVTADRPAVLDLLARSLGWDKGADHARLFAWKHDDNPFGRSPSWVAVDGGRVIGFRTFLRWEFDRGGAVVRAVRAVDTATHPDHRGQGVFSRLTLAALEELRDEGVAFVFNTPNDQSRPGYLKMGWEPVGRLPALIRPRSLTALARIARARAPARRWSEPTAAGVPAAAALDLLAARAPGNEQAPPGPLSTRRTAAYLRWRYAEAPLAYRALTCDEGAVVFRLRRRGAAIEAAVGDVLEAGGRLLGEVARRSGADYALRLGQPGAGYLRVPGQGPLLVWRALADDRRPALADWRLTLGDVELF